MALENAESSHLSKAPQATRKDLAPPRRQS